MAPPAEQTNNDERLQAGLPVQSDEPPKGEQIDGRPPAVAAAEERDPNKAEREQARARAAQVKATEKAQADQLKAGQRGNSDHSEETIAEQRAGHPGAQPVGGRIDNMTRRSDADVLDGHFCTIDLEHDGAREAVEAVIGEGNAQRGVAGDYGIYLQPGQIGANGYPDTAVVMLRDEHAAQVVVPYAALSPAPQGGRR
jgi:hypothetical protein